MLTGVLWEGQLVAVPLGKHSQPQRAPPRRSCSQPLRQRRHQPLTPAAWLLESRLVLENQGAEGGLQLDDGEQGNPA